MIPLEAASAAGVLVANTPGANATSVAEYVMFCCLTLARRFRLIDAELRTKGWNESRQHAATATELGGKTMGLIGVGHVGRAISELAQAFQMEVTAFKPHCEGMPAGVKWKLGGRVDVDPVYYGSNFYSDNVKRDQRPIECVTHSHPTQSTPW